MCKQISGKTRPEKKNIFTCLHTKKSSLLVVTLFQFQCFFFLFCFVLLSLTFHCSFIVYDAPKCVHIVIVRHNNKQQTHAAVMDFYFMRVPKFQYLNAIKWKIKMSKKKRIKETVIILSEYCRYTQLSEVSMNDLPKQSDEQCTHAPSRCCFHLDYVTLNCRNDTRDLIVYLFSRIQFAYALSFQFKVFVFTQKNEYPSAAFGECSVVGVPLFHSV